MSRAVCLNTTDESYPVRPRNGDQLFVIEAMKMETGVTASLDGTVEELAVSEGDTVAGGDLLLRLGE